MTGLTVSDIARITGGVVHGAPADTLVASVVIDSRAVTPGAMFAALPGEQADGHDYISGAFGAGAVCCLALRVPEGETRCVITVPDVAAALSALAAYYRGMFDIPVIGVTGSVGKTTAKEMIACVLAQKFNTLKTEKNFNNELGVPLTLFRLEPAHEAAVVEMGISHFGEMTRLARMVRPTIAVYTIIGRSHLEFLGSREGVLRAKSEMLEEMADDATVYVNGDDDLLSEISCRQRKITFGMNAGCDIRATGLSPRGSSGMSCDIVLGDRRIPVVIPSYARHMVYAALAAAAVGAELGMEDDAIISGIAAYVPVGRRANIIETPSITIIDDCYNANPESMAAAIVSASELPGRLVCILGDMLELGGHAEVLHRQAGELAREKGALLLTVGKLSRSMEGRHFEDKRALIAALPDILKKGDNVLVKASHSMAFEEISEALKVLELKA